MSCSWLCRYLFGEEVNGVAFVVFGIYFDSKKSIPSSLQRVQVSTLSHHLSSTLAFYSLVFFNFCNVTFQQINKGKGLATLERENILQTFSTIEELDGNSIYVAVIVQTENGMGFCFWISSFTAMFGCKKKITECTQTIQKWVSKSVAFHAPTSRWWNGRGRAKKHPDCHIPIHHPLQENTQIFQTRNHLWCDGKNSIIAVLLF